MDKPHKNSAVSKRLLPVLEHSRKRVTVMVFLDYFVELTVDMKCSTLD